MDDADEARRLRRIEIDPRLLLDMFRRGAAFCCESGIPHSARIRSVGEQRQWQYEIDRDLIALIIEDASFEPVPEGQIIPLLEGIRFRRLPEMLPDVSSARH